jgi:hypothetical protein
MYCKDFTGFNKKSLGLAFLYPPLGSMLLYERLEYTKAYLHPSSPLRVFAENNKSMEIFGRPLPGLCNGLDSAQSYFNYGVRWFETYFDRDARVVSIFNAREPLEAMQEMVQEDLRLATLEEGHIGWAHPDADLGDHIFLLSGCSTPIVLRLLPEKRIFVVVGHSYVDGFMNNEIWDSLEKSDLDNICIC